jgi:cytoskeletal protein CcmA (bactofilin family)
MEPSAVPGRVLARGIVALVAALVVLSVVPGTVVADQRVGGTVVVAEGETVEGLEAVSGTVLVRGTVDGDLEGAGGTVVVAESGTVTGDVSVSAGTVQIDGTVDGDVEVGAGTLTVGETAEIGGTLEAGAGTVVLDGSVAGDATIGTDRLVLGSTAALDGDLTVGEGTTVVRKDGATVSGTLVRENLGGSDVASTAGPDWAFTVWGFAANLLLGAALLVVFPRFSRRVADAVGDEPARTGGAGLATFVGVPLVLVALTLSIVGIPLALVLGLPVLVVGGWIALVYGRFAVADWALRRAGYDNRWASLVVGIVVLGLAGMVPVVGGLVDFLVFVLGLGALALGIYELRRGDRESHPGEKPAPPESPAAGTA